MADNTSRPRSIFDSLDVATPAASQSLATSSVDPRSDQKSPTYDPRADPRSLFNRITPAATAGEETGARIAAQRNSPPGSPKSGTIQPQSNIFGSSTTPATTQSHSSIFGASANPATTQSQSNLFGPGATSATSAAEPKSLFDRITPAATAPEQPRPLFGSVAPAPGGVESKSLFDRITPATTQPAATPSQSSIFGCAARPQQPAQSTAGVFANPLPQNTSQATASGSLFGAHTSEGNVALQRDSHAAPGYFQSLLDRGKKRQMEDNAMGELPQLQLGLQDISRKVRNLGRGGPSSTLSRGGDSRAQYLLSASGVNTNAALRDLETLAGPATVRQTSAQDALGDPLAGDVKETLARNYQIDFLNMVNRRIQRSNEQFDHLVEERMHNFDLDAERQRIYEHFGLRKPQHLDPSSQGDKSFASKASFGRLSRRDRLGAASMVNGSSFGIPGMSKSVIGTPGPRGARSSAFADVGEKMAQDSMRPAPEDATLRRKQELYADSVKDLNIARLHGRVYPVMARFSEIENNQTVEDTSMLVNAYKALVQITGEDASSENISDAGAIKERQYSTDYLDENHNSRGQIAIRKQIINGSRNYLEKVFHSHVDLTVTKNPREALMGGTPTSLATLKGYVRVRAARRELGPDLELLQEVDGVYCWALIFYAMRSGLYEEALQYIDENAAAFRQIDRQFMRYLRAFVANEDHRLPADLQTSIANEYSQRQRLAPEDSIDPYRMMCYKIVGRCDLGRRNLDNITSDMMDWLWLQFAMAREYNRVDEFAHEAFGLDDVRQSIKDIGERYFGSGSEIANAPTTFFFMQILAGLFEKAIADLYPHSYLSATHFAIALDFYGLLRVADFSNSDDLLTYTTRQQAQIAFGSMVGLYTRDFRTANATAAIDYIALICLNADLPGQLGKAQRELCHQALTEVVLETREFAQLLGDIRSDGQRIQGAIEQRLRLIGLDNERDFLKHITMVAARIALEQSRTTDAALLFHLAEDYNKVIKIVNDAVSLALTTEIGDKPARLTPLLPRNTEDQNNQSRDQQQGSLSLTAIDDPVQLAQGMRNLYHSSAMYFSKIDTANDEACDVLLRLAEAHRELESGRWSYVVDNVTNSGVIPTEAGGNISAIRGKAQAFDVMPTAIARTVGHVMIWTLVACDNQVRRLRNQEFETGPLRQQTIQRCVQTAKDVMIFAGLIKYKLPGRVWEMLARAGQDLGAY